MIYDQFSTINLFYDLIYVYLKNIELFYFKEIQIDIFYLKSFYFKSHNTENLFLGSGY